MYVLGIATAAAFLADQGAKYLVARRLAEGWAPGGGWPRLRPVIHRGGWLGRARGRGALVGLWGAAALGVVMLAVLASPERSPLLPLWLGVGLGGATANAWDRLRRGGVLDFIDLRVWPVFNLADVAIVAGVGGALWCLR
jgi:lipoprotein signal peptidase